VEQLAYLGVLAFIVAGSCWLEVVLRTRVLRRARRLVLSLAPVLALFLVWDAYAIASGHWWFDPERTTGVVLPADIPIEELLFFVVVPLAGVLTLEAVRSARGWTVGDEPGDRP
jgi:lycopene cyclase domain-containing protein